MDDSNDANNFNFQCDVESDYGICLNQGRKVIAPNAPIPRLIAHYTFDDKCIDSTPNQNHATRCSDNGAFSILPQSQSASIFEGSAVSIPHGNAFI